MLCCNLGFSNRGELKRIKVTFASLPSFISPKYSNSKFNLCSPQIRLLCSFIKAHFPHLLEGASLWWSQMGPCRELWVNHPLSGCHLLPLSLKIEACGIQMLIFFFQRDHSRMPAHDQTRMSRPADGIGSLTTSMQQVSVQPPRRPTGAISNQDEEEWD